MTRLSDPHIDLYRTRPEALAILAQYRESARLGYFTDAPQVPFGFETMCRHLSLVLGTSEDLLSAGTAIAFCTLQAERANFPLWKVDADIVDALLRTEPAPARYDPLPFPGLYLQIPPSDNWVIRDPDTGPHRVVGAYLAESVIKNRAGEWVKGILCAVVGEVKSITVFGLDDVAVFFALNDERPSLADIDASERAVIDGHAPEVFCRNFLYALRTRNLVVLKEEVKVPKSNRKRAKAERHGRLREYSTVRISVRPTPAPSRQAPTPSLDSERKGPRPHVRRAHFRHTWTLTAEEGFVERQDRDGKPPLYKVARWILMTQVGGTAVGLRPKAVVR